MDGLDQSMCLCHSCPVHSDLQKLRLLGSEASACFWFLERGQWDFGRRSILVVKTSLLDCGKFVHHHRCAAFGRTA